MSGAAGPDWLPFCEGLLGDATMLAREGRATPADIDRAMQLGAGHAQGPFSMLATLPAATAVRFGPIRAGRPAGEAVRPDATAWTGSVGLIGTGLMGSGIAETVLRSGREVTALYCTDGNFEAMRSRIGASLDRSVAKGRFTAADAAGFLARLGHVTAPAALGRCDVVLEAVKEDLAVKRAVFARAHAELPRGIPFATNTSSFRVADMADASPGRPVFAMHFFNPAPVMRLVELVFPDDAPPDLAAAAAGFVRALGKTEVFCADTRGFLLNRLLIPFLNDCVRAHEAGRPIEEIERIMTGSLGHPMGPFALLDLIGIDTTIFALEAMAETEGGGRLRPAGTLRSLAREGRLGRKNGRGFFSEGSGP